MTISRICRDILVVSGVVMLVGCSAWNGRPDTEPHIVSPPYMNSKSLAGIYPDVGPDGGIKPHSASSNK